MPIQIEVRPILPPRNVLSKKMDAIESAVTDALKGPVSDILTRSLLKRSAKWSTQPKWYSIVSKYTLKVNTRSKKWLWVSGGTRARPIYPRRKKALAFGTGYVPHTLPKGTYGQAGKFIWDTVVRPAAPNYPGIAARNFEDDVVKEEGKKVIAIIQAAIDSA